MYFIKPPFCFAAGFCFSWGASYFSETPNLCAKAIGLNDLSFIQVQVLSALTHVISNALPNIAGMGSAEAAFLLLFPQCMNPADGSSVLILYRLFTYFVPFLNSAFVTE